tara:strand:+ start:330 stop:1217 length:888 start_codon:yes stop_codon:yes gene_type:complete
MPNQKIKHSKIRNTGLLYEFLLRQITADVLDKQNKSTAVHILKRRFNENTELGKELALYNIIVNKKFKTDKQADYFINEVLAERGKLNSSTLKREKYNLIKTLKENYNLNKFLSSKVNNYKTYASIFKLFEYYNVLSPDQKTEAHFNLVEHVTTNKKELKLSETVGGTKLPNDEDLRILTYRTLLEKFNQKYTKLNLPQKSLLRAYINNVSGTNSLKEFIEKIKPIMKKDLNKYSKNLQDKVVKIKLKEAVKSMDTFCKVSDKQNVDDKIVVQTMRYMELLKELKKSGSKNKKTL